MADLRQCDGCKKISPNAKGLYLANSWYEITITRMSGRFQRIEQFLLCEECVEEEKVEWLGKMWKKLTCLIKKSIVSR